MCMTYTLDAKRRFAKGEWQQMKLNPEFSIANFEVGGYRVEVDGDGTVEIEADCCCGTWTTAIFTIEQLQMIVNAARDFREQRKARGGQ